jgi:cytohesin
MEQHLFDAAVKGDEEAVEHVLAQGASITAVDHHGRCVLHWAAFSESGQALVTMLVNRGANVNTLDNDGRSPLHYFVEKAALYGAVCLLQYGADVNARSRDEQGETPLHVAARENLEDMAQLLLAYGANPNAVDVHGRKPQDLGLHMIFI